MVAKGVATLVPEIDAFRVQFEHISAEADALVAPLSDKQFTWQPARNVWSVSLCLDHLNVTARQYLPVMDDGIAEAVRRGLYGSGPYSYNWVGRMIVYFAQPTVRLRTRSPVVFQPTPGRSRHDVMAGLSRVPSAIHRSPSSGKWARSGPGPSYLAGRAPCQNAARVQLRRNAGPRAPPPCAGSAGHLNRGIPALTDTVQALHGAVRNVFCTGPHRRGSHEGTRRAVACLACGIAEEIQLPADERSDLFYALLMKDAGCSSNASRVFQLFGGRRPERETRALGARLAEMGRNDHLRPRRSPTTTPTAWPRFQKPSPPMGLSASERTRLRRAALLHDIGKLSVPNRILDKPGKLDADEWDVVKRHPHFTHEILALVPVFSEFAYDASCHDERIDGRGYHRGVRGESLSVAARIMATADIFDALSAARPYRDALPTDRVLSIVSEERGTQLCPDDGGRVVFGSPPDRWQPRCRLTKQARSRVRPARLQRCDGQRYRTGRVAGRASRFEESRAQPVGAR